MPSAERSTESAIDLDAMPVATRSDKPENRQRPRPPTRPAIRYLVTVAATALIAVVATLVVTGDESESVAARDMAELEAGLYEELVAETGDDATLVSVWGIRHTPAHVAMQAGSYRLAIKCGMMQNRAEEAQFVVTLGTITSRHRVTVACPSTVVWLEARFEFDEVSPVVLEAYELMADVTAIAVIAVVPEGNEQ